MLPCRCINITDQSFTEGFIIDIVFTTSKPFTINPVAIGLKQAACEPPPPPPPEYDHPDSSTNEKDCYLDGRKSGYDSIVYAAHDFCDDLKHDPNAPFFGPGFIKKGKKSPVGNYHFILEFEIFDGCSWMYDYDECMRYFRVPIDSCNCSKRGDKQGGTMKNNCMYLRLDPNSGL